MSRNLEKTSARKMVLFFVVDTSGSMSGAKIGALNNAVEEILPVIGEISKNNNEAEIEIAVLQFSSGVKWLYQSPVSVKHFNWRDLTTSGVTDFGAACKELATKLTRNIGGFMNHVEGSFEPAFILLSDGHPTDSYKTYLKDLKENKWFKYGIKVSIAIGSDADKVILGEFAENIEGNSLVYEVHNVKQLKTVIKVVSATVSRYGSQSSTDPSKSKEKQIKEQIDTKLKNEQPSTKNNKVDWEF